MKRLVWSFVFAACVFAADVKVFFSQGASVDKELIGIIDKEEKKIQACVFMFTSHPIADALIRAKVRGVDVEVLIDSGSLKYRQAIDKMVTAGVSVFKYTPVDKKGWTSLCHHKFCVFESSKAVWTGSYNFTKKAEMSNRENALLITKDDAAFKGFVDEFMALKSGPVEQLKVIGKPATMKGNGI